tara:strand:+ start:65 stop:316 length:252 start_codon:yes stop_codon:yes gene_type:complete
MANSKKFDREISDYLDGELNPEQRKKFELAVANNPELAKRFNELHSADTFMKTGKFDNIPESIKIAINKMQKVHNEYCKENIK